MRNEIKFINEKEVSIITGMSIQTLRNRRSQGEGASHMLNSHALSGINIRM